MFKVQKFSNNKIYTVLAVDPKDGDPDNLMFLIYNDTGYDIYGWIWVPAREYELYVEEE